MIRLRDNLRFKASVGAGLAYSAKRFQAGLAAVAFERREICIQDG